MSCPPRLLKGIALAKLSLAGGGATTVKVGKGIGPAGGERVIPPPEGSVRTPTELCCSPGYELPGIVADNCVGITSLLHGSDALPTFTVVAPPPANDNFASAMPFNSLGGQLIVDSSAATMQSTDPSCHASHSTQAATARMAAIAPCGYVHPEFKRDDH